MELVDFKNRLNSHVLEQDILKQLIDKIGNIPNITKLKSDIELILYLCNVVENIIKKNDKINKKELVLNVLDGVFQLSDDEKRLISETIDFLSNNGKIKAVTLSKKVFKSIGGWIAKKLF
jgi:hypothetical protein